MNPWLIAIRATWPYLLAAAIGFGAGWALNGLNVTAARNARDQARNDFTAYKVEQDRLANEARSKADQQRQETADAWAKNLEQVLNDKGAYERCVAAGRCGAVVRVLPGASCPQAGQLQTSIQSDDHSPGTVPASAGVATPSVESSVAGLIEDCKVAVATANALQADIERQPNWAP